MRNTLIFLGGLFSLLVVLVSVWIGRSLVEVRRENESSQAYVDSAILLLVKGWDPNQLRSRASAELSQKLTADNLARTYAVLRDLGDLIRYDGSSGRASIMNSTRSNIHVTAEYVARAEFVHGYAEIRLGLVKENGKWKINSYQVNSPRFLLKK